jgi:hypothetical protein
VTVSKSIAPRKDDKSSASACFKYGEGLGKDKETGANLDKSHRTRLGGFIAVENGVYENQGSEFMSEILDMAAKEMQANCDLNKKVAESKKIEHFIFSFDQERPSEAALLDTEDSALKALKLDDNHFVSFLHDDSGHWHLHVFASRIDKEKHNGNSLWRDQILRDKVCREIEIRHNLIRDEGAHRINEAGEIIEIPLIERRAIRQVKREQKGESILVSDKVRTAEIHSGEKSFQTWCNEIRIGDRLKHAKSWQELHAAAAAYGCEVKPKGAGFVICPLNEKGGIQLSKIGLKNLPAKFGAFEVAMSVHQVRPDAIYKPAPTNEKGASHYASWQAAKKAFLPIRTEQINALRESHRSTRKLLKDSQLSELKKIRKANQGADKYAAVSIAKMQHAIDQAALTDRFSIERKFLFKELAAQGPGNTFRDYILKEAGKGDNIALGLARKYGVDEATNVSRERETGQLQIRASVSGHDYRPAPRMSFTHRIERSGTVVYNLGNGRIVTDSATSKQIQLNEVAANDPAAIATSLRFASSKFGNTLTLTGSPEFQKLAVEVAARERLGIRFADPTLEAYREKLLSEQQHRPTFAKEKQYAQRDRIERFKQIPPAHIRERLYNLSSSDLVLDVNRDVSSLWEDVSGSVDKPQKNSNHGMQRPTGRTARTGATGAGRSDRSDTNKGLRPATSEARRFATDPNGIIPLVLSSNQPGEAEQAQRAAEQTEKKSDVGRHEQDINHFQTVAAQQMTAEKWAHEFSQSQGLQLGVPYSSGKGQFKVLYVAQDGVVLDRGQTIAVYQNPNNLILQAGNKVVVGKDMALQIQREKQRDGQAL